MKKILVIENDPEEMERAKTFLEGIEGVEGVYAKDFEEASYYLGVDGFCPDRVPLTVPQVDAVLSDILFPLVQEGYFEDRYIGDDEPIGVSIMMICQKQNIPCILVSSEFHHGPRLQWITALIRALEFPEIVGGTTSALRGVKEPKKWDDALEKLKELMG